MKEETIFLGIGDLDMLADCLSRTTPVERISAIRTKLFGDATAWERLFALASARRMMPVLAMRLRDRRLVPPEIASPVSGKLSPAAILTAQWKHHEAVRAQQETVLKEVISVLGELGIELLLLKGARSLWLGTDPWRTMRDLDVLVPLRLADDAYQALVKVGFTSLKSSRPARNHFAPLFRSDLPGWLEVHYKASGHYAEPFLPTKEVMQRSVRCEKEGRHVRVMTAADQVWHGLVHHHFGHRAFRSGLIDLKGLFEFAEGFADLTQPQFEVLVGLARRNAVGLAAFELWVAAAVDVFAAPLPGGASVMQDARASWERMKMRMMRDQPTPWYVGYFETTRLALASDRVGRASAGRTGGRPATMWRGIERLLPRWR